MTKEQSVAANSIHYYRRSEQINNKHAQYWLEQIRQSRTKKEVNDVYNNFTKFINTLKANKKKKKESDNRRRKLNAMNGPSPLR